MIYYWYLFDNIFFYWYWALKCLGGIRIGHPAGSVINWPSGSGSVSQDYGSGDPDPKKIFTDPQHC